MNAKKEGKNSLSYVYKILMNSLYGRFGLNTKSTITDICDKNREKILLMSTGFIYGDLLSEDYYRVSYVSNSGDMMDGTRKQIENSAVQISAAITASAKIYMYPFISREDCYYTDTDSVIFGNKLPEEHISKSVLGLFKLE